MTQKIPPLASKQLEPLLIPITDIKPHPDNYKSHPAEQLRSLKASLKTFSWTTPIKANLEGFIIAGHGMYQVALEEGYTHVPVEFCALDKQLSKAYLIADNETARRAVTEQDKLNELLEGALSIPDFDIEAVGFSSEDIDSLLKSGEVGEVVEDEFNSDGEIETRCKEGDLWQLGRHRLLCADSSIKENIKKLIENDKIDMVLTDPPYGVQYQGFNVHPARKDVKAGIDFMKGKKKHVSSDSINWIKEARNYKYKETKDKVVLDEPVKYMDHIMDASRYGAFTAFFIQQPSRPYITSFVGTSFAGGSRI